ncbi:MAG TPA: creatininase family protein [Gemmataceae bacterium]|jgi:creatinine amidohydrolase|nr:creatininase family protein [Gemmataceae bacterium]
MREWILAEQNHSHIRAHQWEVAVLPFGATEPHNLHMPYGTDILQVEEIGDRACAKAYQAGAKVLLLPAIPFGVNTNHLKVPGALACSLTPTTLLAILSDLVEAFEKQGLRKLVLLNGHGGNELKPLMRQLHHRSKVFLCLCDWFRMVADVYPRIFDKPGEHADEVETSLGLAFFPELMQMDLADEGRSRPSSLDAVNRGWISITRPWHLATTNTGMGDPRAASAAKGQALMDVLVNRLGDFLIQLAAAPYHESFPYNAETE